MLRHIGILILIYLGLVAQCSLVPQATIVGRPFLPAFILVVIVAACEPNLSLLWAALLGLALDGLSTERLGLQVAIAAMLAFGLQLMRPIWQSRSLLSLVSMVLLTSVTWRLLVPTMQAALADRAVDPHVLLTDAVQDAAWTAGVSAALILLVRGLFGQRARPAFAVSRPATRWVKSPAMGR